MRSMENPFKFGTITWGRNWNLIFHIEQLHEGVIR